MVKTPNKKIVHVDTDVDTIFAKDNSTRNYEYFFSENYAFYAAKKNESGEYKIIHMTLIELSELISCAEIINEKCAIHFMKTFNDIE